MDNGIKRQFNDEALFNIVERAFGSGRTMISAHELTDGWFNSAYVITLDNDMKVVLKASPYVTEGFMRYERNIMKTEVEVLHLLKKAGTIPVPEVYYYHDVAGEPEWFLMEHLSGQPYNKIKDELTAIERIEIERELGRINRNINDITGERFGYYGIYEKQGTCWSDVFIDMVSDILADARDANVTLPMMDADVLTFLESRRVILDEVTMPCLIHWDLWDGNLFVENGRIAGIIDCERALWGDYLMEYYFRTLSGQPSAFMEGYGLQSEIHSLTESQLERLQIYDLYLALVFRIECNYRKYTDRNHIQWTIDNLVECWNKI